MGVRKASNGKSDFQGHSLAMVPFDRPHTIPVSLPPFLSYSKMLVENHLLHFYLALPLGVTPSEFRRVFWDQKTRVPGISYGVVCMILCLAVLV